VAGDGLCEAAATVTMLRAGKIAHTHDANPHGHVVLFCAFSWAKPWRTTLDGNHSWTATSRIAASHDRFAPSKPISGTLNHTIARPKGGYIPTPENNPKLPVE